MVNVVDFSGSRAAFQHPPSSTTNHGEPREAQGAALQRGNTSCSPGCFPSPELNPNEWSRREMIQTWRELWCQLREIWHQTPAGTRWEIEIYLRCFCTSSLRGAAHVSARKYKLHRRGLLALSGNYSPKRLRDMWAPFSGVPSDPAAYSRLRDTSTPWLPQSKKSLKVPNQPTPPRQLGYNTPRAVTGGFFVFFFAKSGLGTHRILLPLLAFLSTFFLILLRSFWMANHCLGNAEQENNFRALNTLWSLCIKSSTSQPELPQVKEVSSREKLLLVINIFFLKLKRASSHLIYTMKTRHQGKNLTNPITAILI